MRWEVRTVELSKSYAAALFSLAAESGEQEEVSRALETVTQVLRENPDYLEFLAAPSIAIDERSAAIDQAFGGRVPEHVTSFLQVLCRRGHARSYFECAEEYRRLKAEKRKRIVVTVFSVLICVLLIFAFCFPAVTMLMK